MNIDTLGKVLWCFRFGCKCANAAQPYRRHIKLFDTYFFLWGPVSFDVLFICLPIKSALGFLLSG